MRLEVHYEDDLYSFVQKLTGPFHNTKHCIPLTPTHVDVFNRVSRQTTDINRLIYLLRKYTNVFIDISGATSLRSELMPTD